MKDFTPGPWTNGWGLGLTGPNTPPCRGVTVAEACAWYDWYKAHAEGKDLPAPKPSEYYIPISVGSDTVAVAVGPNREGNACLISKAPAGYELAKLVEKLWGTHIRSADKDAQIRKAIREMAQSIVDAVEA